jgi:hypothetical protein
MERFLDGNPGESSSTPSPTTNGYESKIFYQLLEDARRELYPSCKKFSMHYNMNNKVFDMETDLIKRALPDGETIPILYYEAKQLR